MLLVVVRSARDIFLDGDAETKTQRRKSSMLLIRNTSGRYLLTARRLGVLSRIAITASTGGCLLYRGHERLIFGGCLVHRYLYSFFRSEFPDPDEGDIYRDALIETSIKRTGRLNERK